MSAASSLLENKKIYQIYVYPIQYISIDIYTDLIRFFPSFFDILYVE